MSEARLGAVALDREEAGDEASLRKRLLLKATGSLKVRQFSVEGAVCLSLERSLRREAEPSALIQLGPQGVRSFEMERERLRMARRLPVCERSAERVAAGVKIE